MANSIVGFFVPHPTNNHRARALHVESLLCYVFLFVVIHFSSGWAHKAYPDVLGYATDIRVEQLLTLINQKRKEQGLAELLLNSQLSMAAASKAQDMFTNNYWAHNSPQGKVPWDFINVTGYKYTVAGENLAKNFTNSSGVVEAWMNSLSHRENIFKPSYKDVGFAVINGILNGEETTLVVQMFGASNEAPLIQTQEIINPVQAQAPVVIPVQAVSVEKETSVLPVFTQVLTRPRIDILAFSRIIVYGFIGFLLGVLALDGYLVMKRKIVRVAGHNISHIFFFIAVILATTAILPGSIL